MKTPPKMSLRLPVVVLMLLSSTACWAGTTPRLPLASALPHCLALGSPDDWVAMLFALLAGLLCVQQRQN